MTNKINVKLILELREAGLSRNMIASTRHMSKHSVSDVIHLSDSLGITYSDVRDLDEAEIYRMLDCQHFFRRFFKGSKSVFFWG